jgi:hypothetical protein
MNTFNVLYCNQSTTGKENFPESGIFKPVWHSFNKLMTNSLQAYQKTGSAHHAQANALKLCRSTLLAQIFLNRFIP